jgi:hypothetical protein
VRRLPGVADVEHDRVDAIDGELIVTDATGFRRSVHPDPSLAGGQLSLRTD